MYQKPMPKQDKGGGINLTAEGARGVLQAASSGATKRRLAACFAPSIARSQHAGNPRWETETPKEIWTEIWRDPLQSHYKYVIIML